MLLTFHLRTSLVNLSAAREWRHGGVLISEGVSVSQGRQTAMDARLSARNLLLHWANLQTFHAHTHSSLSSHL